MAKSFEQICISLQLRFLKRNIITDVLGRGQAPRRALVYFKTDPFFSRRLRDAYVHTNNAEIVDMVQILDRYGFIVDVVDRGASWEEIASLQSRKYDFYLGNAAGNSAPFHARILQEFKLKAKVFFGAGPEPQANNALTLARHRDFDWRHNQHCVVRRLVRGDSFDDRFTGLSAIFFVGNAFSRESYARHGVPSYRIVPSSSPRITFDGDAVTNKDRRRFLYFGGNGLICKGLDLVLEAFDGLIDVHLDIGAPATEEDFWSFYQPLLARNPQIHFHGFIPVGGTLFHQLTEKTAFQIFPGSSEGCATSVVTAMRRGVIPVVTHETGIDLDDFGVLITPPTVSGIRTLVGELHAMPEVAVRERVVKTYTASALYSRHGFQSSFEKALLATLIQEGVLGTRPQ